MASINYNSFYEYECIMLRLSRVVVVFTYLYKWQFIIERRKLINTWKVNAKEINGMKDEDNVRWQVKAVEVHYWATACYLMVAAELTHVCMTSVSENLKGGVVLRYVALRKARIRDNGCCRGIDTRRIQQTNRSGECSLSGLHKVIKGHVINSRKGSRIWDSKIYCIMCIVHCKRQTRPLVREGIPYQKPAMIWQ
jgi:hypothetical protein